MIQVSTSSLSIRIPRGTKPQMRNPNRSNKAITPSVLSDTMISTCST